MKCLQTEVHIYCDVHRLFSQLHIPQQEQTILMNMAYKKKMDCENFKNILLFLLQSKSKIIKSKNIKN
jgi:hypothetical protein